MSNTPRGRSAGRPTADHVFGLIKRMTAAERRKLLELLRAQTPDWLHGYTIFGPGWLPFAEGMKGLQRDEDYRIAKALAAYAKGPRSKTTAKKPLYDEVDRLIARGVVGWKEIYAELKRTNITLLYKNRKKGIKEAEEGKDPTLLEWQSVREGYARARKKPAEETLDIPEDATPEEIDALLAAIEASADAEPDADDCNDRR